MVHKATKAATIHDETIITPASYDDNEAAMLGRAFARSLGLKAKRQGDATYRWQCDDRSNAFHDKTSIGVWRTVERLSLAVVLGDPQEIEKVLSI